MRPIVTARGSDPSSGDGAPAPECLSGSVRTPDLRRALSACQRAKRQTHGPSWQSCVDLAQTGPVSRGGVVALLWLEQEGHSTTWVPGARSLSTAIASEDRWPKSANLTRPSAGMVTIRRLRNRPQ